MSNVRKTVKSGIEPVQPCGCVIRFSNEGLIEGIDFCQKHSPSEEQLKQWSAEDLSLYVVENFKMMKGTVAEQWQDMPNDKCAHCYAETIPAHEYRKLLVKADSAMGPEAKGLSQIFSSKGFECPNCHKDNYLHVYLVALEDRPEEVLWHAYAFPTFEHVKEFAYFIGKRDFETARMLKV